MNRWQKESTGVYSKGQVRIEKEFLALTRTTWWVLYVKGDRLRAFASLASAKRNAEINLPLNLKETL